MYTPAPYYVIAGSGSSQGHSLLSSNSRQYIGQEIYPRAHLNPRYRQISSPLPGTNATHFSTPAASTSLNYLKNEETSTGQNHLSSAVPGGHYCHLSYYGEEVDKEYLPLPEINLFGNENGTRSRDYNYNFNSLAASQPSGGNGYNYSINVESPGNGYDNDSNQFQVKRRRQEEYPDDVQRPNISVDNGYTPNVHDPDMNFPGAGSNVCNFQAAASSFQERQQLSSSSSISFQGWSGAASNQFVERKVVLTDSSSGCDHSTKLKRRLNRFGDDGLSANLECVSLDEVIQQKKRNQNNRLSAECTITKEPSQAQPKNAGMPHSTWMSGNGKSFSVVDKTGVTAEKSEQSRPKLVQMEERSFRGRTSFIGKPQPQQERRAYPYSRFDGRRRTNGKDHIFIEERKDQLSIKRETRSSEGWSGRAVVIDGASVAFRFGDNLHFHCEGIHICVNHFRQLGCDDITVIVPKDRMKKGASKDGHILQMLRQRKMLMVNWMGNFSGDNDQVDKYFILDAAVERGAVIISNMNFRNIVRKSPHMRQHVWNRVINFEFNKKETPPRILFPDIDDAGLYGSPWKEVFERI